MQRLIRFSNISRPLSRNYTFSAIRFNSDFHFHNPTAAESATTQTVLQAIDSDKSANELMPASRLPQDFVENTFVPHLEHAIVHQSMTFSPYDLQRVAIAYSQMPVRQKALEGVIGERVIENMRYFESWNIVPLLSALRTMQPENTKMWVGLCKRIDEQLAEFTTVNLIAVFRIIGQLTDKFPEADDLIVKVNSRLNTELADFEGSEFSEMLRVLADHAAQGDTRQDKLLIGLFMPHIEAKYAETSMIHSLEIIWCLIRMKVLPLKLLKKFEDDLTEARLLGMPPKHLALLCWVFDMMDRKEWLWPKIKPILESISNELSPADFARLSLAIPRPEGNVLLNRIVANLSGKVPDMSRNEILLFFNGVINSEIMPTPLEVEASNAEEDMKQHGVEEPEANHQTENTKTSSDQDGLDIHLDRRSVFDAILGYFHSDKDLFTKGEIEKITFLLMRTPKYRAFVEDLPKEWRRHIWQEVDKKSKSSLFSNILGGTSSGNFSNKTK